MTEPSWVAELRDAAQGRARPGVEVVRGERPGLLASGAIQALTGVILAAFVIAAAFFRAQVAPLSFDLLALLLRTAALAFTVRALIVVFAFARQLARGRDARAHMLAWSAAGILERMGARERWASREDVLAVVAREPTRSRAALSGSRPVFLVLRPQTRVEHWELPEHLALPELLVARLTRWLTSAPGAAVSTETPAPPTIDPSYRYQRAAEGKPQAGELVVPEGTGYRARAPYTALLGLVFALDALRVAGPLRARLIPALFAAVVLSLGFLAGWFLWMRRRRSTRLGIAMLLTPEELLVRGAHGVVSVPWPQLASVRVRSGLAWSPFVGSFAVRGLDLETVEGTRLTFDAGFLGVPIEPLCALLEAYRARRA